MGLYSAHSTDSFGSSFGYVKTEPRTNKYWDPTSVLNIINPDRRCMTCVGYAPSCGRRCRNPINHANRAEAHRILDELSYMDVSKVDVTAKLHKLATRTLCLRYHQGQAYDMVDGWSKLIKRTNSSSKSSAYIKPDPDRLSEKVQDLEDMVARLLKQLAAQEDAARRMKEEQAESARQREKKQDEQRRQQEARKASEREEGERSERRRQQRERTDREAKERQGQEEEEGERREKARQQRQKDEAERKEKERQKREAKRKEDERRAKEKEARETEERNERVRQRAEKMRRDRESKAKEDADKAKQEWEAKWLDYVKRWDELKKTGGTKGNPEHLRTVIPWPVKSGATKDVSAEAVEEFYRNATPDAQNPQRMFAFMRVECLIWHADKITGMFGKVEDDDLEEQLRTVSRVAIKLWQEAAGKRNR